MTNEEARTALGDRNNLLWGMSKEEQAYYSEALDMAISALSTVSFPNREKVGTCSKCGKWGKLIGIQDEKFKLWVCPNCGADMRGKAE